MFCCCLLSNGGSIFTTFACILRRCMPSLLKRKFQKVYYKEETIPDHFRFLRAAFINKKANESHPMQGTAIFWNERLSVHFFKSALSRQVHNTSRLKIWNSILDHRNSRLDPLDARLDPQKFWESSLKSWGSRRKWLSICNPPSCDHFRRHGD